MALKSLVRQNIFWRGSFVGSGLLVAILLARSLKASVVGEMFYDIALFSLYIQIAGLSLESGINFYAASKKKEDSDLGVISVLWTLIISVLAAVSFMAIGKNNLGVRSETVNAPMIFGFVAGNTLYSYFSALFSAKLDFKTPNLVGTLVNFLISIIAVLVIFKVYPLGDDFIITMFFYSFLVKGLWVALWHYYKHPSGYTFNSSIHSLSGLFKYSAIACIANGLTFLLNRSDYFFVKKWCTPGDLGNYIQVSKISQMFFLVPGMMSAVIFPIVAGASDPLKFVDQIKKSSGWSFIFGAVGCGILSLSGYWLFPTVFGEDFKNMYVTFLWMMPGIIALCSIFHITAYFAGRNKIWINIKGTAIALLFLWLIDSMVVPKFGIYGAAGVNGACYLFYTLYMLNAFNKEVLQLRSYS